MLVKIAPENASLLLIVSIVAAFVSIIGAGLIITGYVPTPVTQQTPHTGSVDITVSENDEIKFQVTSIGDVDAYIIEKPNGDRSRLVRQGDSIAFNVEDGSYLIYTRINGVERLHQSVHPTVDDIDVSEHKGYSGGNRV